MDKLKIGIIGVGNIGFAHAKSLFESKIEHAELTALCDISSKRREVIGELFPGIALFEDHNKLIDSGLADAVIIAVPHYSHAPIAVDCFNAGLHVMTEKPAGVYIRQAKQMIDAAKSSGKTFGIMFNQRTHPLFAKAKEIVESGLLGKKKRFVWIITNWYRNQEYYNSGGWRGTWRGEGGGVLINQAPHNLDIWQWIFGMPSRITAFCNVGKYHHIEVEDDATIYAEYDDGAVATFITSTGEYPGTNRLEISGDLGKMIIENNIMQWWKLDCPERKYCFESGEHDALPKIEYEETKNTVRETAHKGIIQNFVNNILYGEELLAPGVDGLCELTISNAAYLSAWTGKTVNIPFDENEFEELLNKKAENSEIADSKARQLTGGYNPRWSVKW